MFDFHQWPDPDDFSSDGWAVFVPEYWWKREKNWAARTQKLPGLEAYHREFQLGWNRKVIERRPEVAALVKALGGRL